MTGKKLCPKIILEGTRLTLKTELAFKLNEHHKIVGPRKYRYHSPIISAEWCAFTNYPWGRGLINFAEDEEPKAIETYETWCRLFELQRYYSWIVDRFHISTQAYQLINNHKKINFNWLEKRLHKLGFVIIFCIRRENTFLSAREERIKISGNPTQYDNLRKFIDEQKVMSELISKSILSSYKLDISDKSVEDLANEVAFYLENTGALWSKD
jgi:hypothetical protein